MRKLRKGCCCTKSGSSRNRNFHQIFRIEAHTTVKTNVHRTQREIAACTGGGFLRGGAFGKGEVTEGAVGEGGNVAEGAVGEGCEGVKGVDLLFFAARLAPLLITAILLLKFKRTLVYVVHDRSMSNRE